MNFCKTYKNLQFLQLSIHWILNLGDLCLNTNEKAKATIFLLVEVVNHPKNHTNPPKTSQRFSGSSESEKLNNL